MRSPLHDAHAALGASFTEMAVAWVTEDPEDEDEVVTVDDLIALPACYTDLDVEVAAARRGAAVVDLSHIRVMTLTSPDAKRWCNGMFTNNIRKLQPGQGNRSAICDDRGRVQGIIDLYMVADDAFQATLDGITEAWFSKRYRMFMILDDIELDIPAGAPWLLSVQGPQAAAVLSAAGLPAPEADHAHVAADGIRVARKDRTGLGGFDLICDSDASALSTWQALQAAGAAPLGHAALDALRVLGGRARWPQDGTDKSMVHELAINEEVCAFDKGCYVGQEIINRIDVKGAIQKRLTALRVDGPVPLGTDAYLGDKKIGTLTSAATVGGATYGLAVLRKAAWEPGTAVELRPEGGDAISATVVAPPLSADG